jgi:hypothetical protein
MFLITIRIYYETRKSDKLRFEKYLKVAQVSRLARLGKPVVIVTRIGVIALKKTGITSDTLSLPGLTAGL